MVEAEGAGADAEEAAEEEKEVVVVSARQAFLTGGVEEGRLAVTGDFSFKGKEEEKGD